RGSVVRGDVRALPAEPALYRRLPVYGAGRGAVPKAAGLAGPAFLRGHARRHRRTDGRLCARPGAALLPVLERRDEPPPAGRGQRLESEISPAHAVIA